MCKEIQHFLQMFQIKSLPEIVRIMNFELKKFVMWNIGEGMSFVDGA